MECPAIVDRLVYILGILKAVISIESKVLDTHTCILYTIYHIHFIYYKAYSLNFHSDLQKVCD